MVYIKNFAPSWFASIMGTGILAICCKMFSCYFPYLLKFAHILFWCNLSLFFLFLIFWIARWIFFPKNAKADLCHPVISSFYPTIAVAALVISGGFINIFHFVWFSKIFWIAGSSLTVFFSFLILTIMFTHENITISHINPGWYIPPVGLIVIPVAGAFFEPISCGYEKELITVVNFLGFGAGFFIYMALLSIIVYRLILHSPLPGTLSPTIWINLGPIGAGNIALINIVSQSSFITVKEPFYVFSLIFWGFGLWWFVMAVIITLKYVTKSQLNYSLSWWAFIFPLGAYTASTHIIYKIFKFEIINILGFSFFLLLFMIWIVTLIFTLKNVKTIFEG